MAILNAQENIETSTIWASDVQVCQRYGVSRCTVWRWAKEGRLPPPVKIGPSITRWRLSEVIEKLEGGK